VKKHPGAGSISYISLTIVNQQTSTDTGWWLTYPSEKYESQFGSLFPIYGKIKNVPNHQSGYQ
jgi:hypothetical protein